MEAFHHGDATVKHRRVNGQYHEPVLGRVLGPFKSSKQTTKLEIMKDLAMHIQTLKNDLGDEIFEQIVELFTAESSRHLDALGSQDNELEVRACHNLKTHFRTFGAMEQAEFAESLELDLRDGQSISDSDIQTLTDTTRALQVELKNLAA